LRPQLTGEEQRKLMGGLYQTQQVVDDGGSDVDDDQRPTDDDDELRVRRIAALFNSDNEQDQRRTVKKWSYVGDGSQYNVLDQIGSNIIRRK